MSYDIDQLQLKKSISLHVIADFRVKNFFVECNLKVSGCNQCILATFKQRN